MLRGRLGGGVACNGGNNLGIVRLRPNPSLGLQEGREGGKEEGRREGKGGREGGRLYGPSRDVQGPDVELEARPRSKIAIDRSRHTFSEEVSRNLGSKFIGHSSVPPSLTALWLRSALPFSGLQLTTKRAMNYTRDAVGSRSYVRSFSLGGFGSLDTAAADAAAAAAATAAAAVIIVGRDEGIDSLIALGLNSAPAEPTMHAN